MRENAHTEAGFERVTVQDVMHHGILSCPPETPLRVVARMMAHQRIHCVVVFGEPGNYNDSRPWRLVSDLDLVRVAGPGFGKLVAADAALGPVVEVASADLLIDAVRAMKETGTTHAVVIEPTSRHPIGVVSTLDVVGVLAFDRD